MQGESHEQRAKELADKLGHGEIDNLVSLTSQLTIPLPAVYVIYGGSAYDESANRSYDDEMSFTIIVIAKDLRGDQKLKAAMYPILEELKAVLIDNDLDLDIEPIHPIRIEPTIVTRVFSIYSFDVKTSFTQAN
jgi:hypothetical protein